MGQFRDVLLLLSRLKAEGVIHDYAIGGAVAVSLWAEPVATQDLDVIVTLAEGEDLTMKPTPPFVGKLSGTRAAPVAAAGKDPHSDRIAASRS